MTIELSPAATAALERIRALRLTQKLGFVSTREQCDIVFALNPKDMIAVVDQLAAENRAGKLPPWGSTDATRGAR